MDPFCVKSWTFLLPLLLFVVIVTDTNGFECYTCPALPKADSDCTTAVECAASATGGGCTIESSTDTAGATTYDRGCREKDVVKISAADGCANPTEIGDYNTGKPATVTSTLVTYCFCTTDKCNLVNGTGMGSANETTIPPTEPPADTTTTEEPNKAGTVQIASALLTILYITICFVSNFSQ